MTPTHAIDVHHTANTYNATCACGWVAPGWPTLASAQVNGLWHLDPALYSAMTEPREDVAR